MEHDDHGPRIYGTELEFSLVGRDKSGQKVDNSVIFDWIKVRLPEGMDTCGQFVSNGGRLYKDTGEHVEWSTPECASIDQVLAYELAGEQIVLQALNRAVEDGHLKRYWLHKRVTDGSQFWGAHENYQIQRRFNPGDKGSRFVRGLGSILALRNVLVGSGYIDGKGRFRVAQKAESISELCSSNTTTARPLVNTRDEAWDQPDYRRLHIIAGDASILPWSMKMKLGIIALYLRLSDDGVNMDDLILDDPVRAAREVAYDTATKREVKLASGDSQRPVVILERFAAKARLHSMRRPMLSDEIELIDMLQQACDDLQFRPDRLVRLSDWITRKALIDRMIEQDPPAKLDTLRAKDMQYDQLGSTQGIGAKLRARSAELMAAAETAMLEPPQNTRAALRSRVIRAAAADPVLEQALKSVEWDGAKFWDNREFKLKPLQTSHPQLEAIIGEQPAMALAAS